VKPLVQSGRYQRITHPEVVADFRPMSITPVLTRLMERLIVTQFLYPAITSPSTIFKFSDQYAFRPTGSPTAAILISLLYMVTHQLLTDTRMSVRNHRKALHTLPVPGGALPVQQVDKDLMLSFDEVNVVVCSAKPTVICRTMPYSR